MYIDIEIVQAFLAYIIVMHIALELPYNKT